MQYVNAQRQLYSYYMPMMNPGSIVSNRVYRSSVLSSATSVQRELGCVGWLHRAPVPCIVRNFNATLLTSSQSRMSSVDDDSTDHQFGWESENQEGDGGECNATSAVEGDEGEGGEFALKTFKSVHTQTDWSEVYKLNVADSCSSPDVEVLESGGWKEVAGARKPFGADYEEEREHDDVYDSYLEEMKSADRAAAKLEEETQRFLLQEKSRAVTPQDENMLTASMARRSYSMKSEPFDHFGTSETIIKKRKVSSPSATIDLTDD